MTEEDLLVINFPQFLGATAQVGKYNSDLDHSKTWSVLRVNWDEANSLEKQKFVQLAKAVVMIAQRLGRDQSLVMGIARVVAKALLIKELDPRHPVNQLPLSTQQIDEVINVWDWSLTPKEIGDFAIRKGWPEELFLDLINIESSVIEVDSLETTAPVNNSLIEPKLSKSDKQVKAILEVISDLGFEPMAVPDGGKTQIESLCRDQYSNLFNKDSSFTSAWKKARSQGVVKMSNHESFARRGVVKIN